MKIFIGVTFEHNGELLKEGETIEIEFTEEEREKYKGLYREIAEETILNVTEAITEEIVSQIPEEEIVSQIPEEEIVSQIPEEEIKEVPEVVKERNKDTIKTKNKNQKNKQ